MSQVKNKITVPISGMHCKSCEILVEEKLKTVPGVNEVKVDHSKGRAEIFYNGDAPTMETIKEAVLDAGYKIGDNNKNALFISRDITDYKDLGVAIIILLLVYFIFKSLGITNINIGAATGNFTIPLIFLVGLTAGISTCMALVSGLVLGMAAKHNQLYPEASALEKFRPHLFFNLGRVLGYAILGGLLGILGSVFQLSGFTLGLITILVGVLMFIIGLQLIKIFPWAEKLKLVLPKRLYKLLGISGNKREYSHRNSMILGALTFFLPCGFTQTMQVFAVSTGNFWSGAVIMGTFALGTVPGLLSIGGLTSIIKGAFARRFFKLAGLAVIAFSIFNISNGLGLAGIDFNSSTSNQYNISDPNVTLEDGVQIVRMKETNSGYVPNSFTIKKDIPVRWIIDAQAPFSCASNLIMTKYNIQKNLKSGENTIEFTPNETGKLKFSCSMGMYTGSFNVVDENGQAQNSTDAKEKPTATAGNNCSCSVKDGCSCGQ